MDANKLRYLELLSRSFPNAAKASAEIINLSAIMNLPKGTEFFCTDIHGEYEAFSHILRNGSGSIRLKIDDVFGDSLSDAEKRSLATLIYYPKQKTPIEIAKADDKTDWYFTNIVRLVAVCRWTARKYTRSKVRKLLPEDLGYIMEELITEYEHASDKQNYYDAIIKTVIETGQADALIEALTLLIKKLAIDHLHIIGDIYDRGPAPDAILDLLMTYHSVDIQWGNHDIVWMGAAAGQRGCIAHVVRQCARYGNLSILDDAYGINILPLASFALEAYKDDPCVAYGLKGNPQLTPQEYDMSIKIQKAMAIIQYKVEGQLALENPSFGVGDRRLLHLIDYEKGTITLDGVEYELTDKVFPTVDPADPYALTPGEEDVMQRLEQAFTGCEKLQTHVRFLLDAGSLYKVYNGNLLLHACVPLNQDGTLKEVDIFGNTYKGKALYAVMEDYVRAAFFSSDPQKRKRGRDLMWYLWLGEGSPLFAKSKMATFERYVIADKGPQKEIKNSFYSLLENEHAIDAIFDEFGLNPQTAHIICGHVPVKAKDGEDPVKCNGKVLCIDGGFSRAYQPTTGIAGYTLISNSYGFMLCAHDPLESIDAAVRKELDIHSSKRVVERVERRTYVADTDTGATLAAQIEDLKDLLRAYEQKLIPQRR